MYVSYSNIVFSFISTKYTQFCEIVMSLFIYFKAFVKNEFVCICEVIFHRITVYVLLDQLSLFLKK